MQNERKSNTLTKRRATVKNQPLVTLYAVGDTGLQRATPLTAFERVCGPLAKADILVGNLEAPISDKGRSGMVKGDAPSTAPRSFPLRSDPTTLAALKMAGFHILSLANNHAMDFGAEALVDCLDRLDQEKIAHIGAGRTLAEATAPAVIERNGVKIAFLAYDSTFKGLGRIDSSVIAGPHNPGVAPIRVSALYPAPHVYTRDLVAMTQAIKQARTIADQVVVSCHWGVGFCYGIGVHQTAIGRAAIDAGASLVFGHHPHILQGMEAYHGGLICYSLGEFAFELPYNVPGSFDSIVLQCNFSKKRLEKVSFLPVVMDDARTPEIVSHESEGGRRIVNLLTELSLELDTQITAGRDGIAVKLGA